MVKRYIRLNCWYPRHPENIFTQFLCTDPSSGQINLTATPPHPHRPSYRPHVTYIPLPLFPSFLLCIPKVLIILQIKIRQQFLNERSLLFTSGVSINKISITCRPQQLEVYRDVVWKIWEAHAASFWVGRFLSLFFHNHILLVIFFNLQQRLVPNKLSASLRSVLNKVEENSLYVITTKFRPYLKSNTHFFSFTDVRQFVRK